MLCRVADLHVSRQLENLNLHYKPGHIEQMKGRFSVSAPRFGGGEEGWLGS